MYLIGFLISGTQKKITRFVSFCAFFDYLANYTQLNVSFQIHYVA